MQLFVDVETTGVPKRRGAHWSEVEVWPRIVSIAWVVADNRRRILDRQYKIVKPSGFTIPYDAQRIHGISTEYALLNGEDWDVIASSLILSITRHGVGRLVAHNVDFDIPIILSEFCRAGIDTSIGRIETFCTMKQHGLSGSKWIKLGELYGRLTGKELNNAHNALADVEACMECYWKVCSRIENSIQVNTVLEDRIEYYGNEDELDMIERILSWAEDNPAFDTEFITSLEYRLSEGRELTQAQHQALVNIIERWNIP